MVKSQLPSRATEVSLSKEIHAEIKDLERYTRIINTVLERSSLYDLTDIYKLKTSRRLIYVDNLIEYLPSNVD